MHLLCQLVTGLPSGNGISLFCFISLTCLPIKKEMDEQELNKNSFFAGFCQLSEPAFKLLRNEKLDYFFLNSIRKPTPTQPITRFSSFLYYIVVTPLMLGFEKHLECHSHLGLIWIYLSNDMLDIHSITTPAMPIFG